MSPAAGLKTRLPHTFYVTPGSHDEDSTCFQYGDQSFCSDNKAHSCSFGRFDNGKSEGDCGFNCGPPGANGPGTAPKGARDAFMGHGKAGNKEKDHYVKGRCRVHVQMFQRNENKDSLNPFDQYGIELYLADDQKTIIAYQPKTFALYNTDPVTAQGPLPYEVQVWPGRGDNDSLRFKYNDKIWHSDYKEHCEKFSAFSDGWSHGVCSFDC